MKYNDLKKELIKLYNYYNNPNINEIDYCLGEICKTNILEVKFFDFSIFEVYKIKKIVKQHLKTKIPYQKIFKKAYFFGLEFYVNNSVLTPRFDSEILVETALKEKFNSCLDLCCGSGCLGLSIKNNRKETDLTLADISKKALKVSKINAKKLNLQANFVQTDMFNNINGRYDLIICNPPYIETNVVKNLDDEVKNFDPIISLDGGEDGLKFYKIIFDNLDKFLNENGVCLLEIGYNQGNLINLFKQKYKDVTLIKDYNNLDRVIKIKKE